MSDKYAFAEMKHLTTGKLGTPSAAPTITCFDGLTGNVIAGPTITAVTTGVYRCYVDTAFRHPIFVVTTTDANYPDIALDGEDLAFEVWEEILTGTNHNVATSAGRRLREVISPTHTGIAQGTGGNGNSIQLDAGASAVDGAYDPSLIVIVKGTGAGQARNIFEYDGTTKIAYVGRDWKVDPDATSEFEIYPDAGREHTNEGLAQGGTINTITLNALASSVDDLYNGQVISIRSGTGEDQASRILAYNGTTKVATLYEDWDVIPDITSVYAMLTTGTVIGLGAGFAEAVWAYITRTLTQAPGTVASAILGTGITDIRGNTWEIELTLDTDLTNKKVQFGIKKEHGDSDADSLIQIDTTDKLTVVNGSPITAPDNTKGTIDLDVLLTGEITINLDAEISAQLSPQSYTYGIQLIDTVTDKVEEIFGGTFTVSADIVKAVT